MTNLISGKEALIALANGDEVEYMDTSNTFKSPGWCNAFGLETNLFFNDRFKFRLKTIKLNGIEVPKPFVPKVGETYWYFSTQTVLGYGHNVYVSDNDDKRFINMGAWRSEEEIKQVVEALRTIFKTD